jgi:hypothetical protein
MAGPLKSITSPITSIISRAFTLPGQGGQQQQQSVASPPTPAPPAASPQGPSGATSTAGSLAQTQLSFLTAASKAAAAIGQGATTGKSLLGA